MEIKVNHRKCFSPSGCVYQRGFKISYKIFRDFFIYLQSAIKKEEDNYKKMYLKSKFENEADFVFMNLTQTKLFVEWALNNKEIKINKKRARLNVNGYLYILKN